MALLGVRDMSVIDTPPKNRMPVETFVMEYHENIIKQAIERELARKGQVYFVHNRVQSIDRVHERMQKLLPGVRFGVMHGQMKVDMLEDVMKKFLHGEIDCLRAAGRIRSYADAVLHTTLAPCAMCSGAIVQFGIRRVVVGEATTFPGELEWMRSRGVDVVVLDDPQCQELMRRFATEYPAVWAEDIGEVV